MATETKYENMAFISYKHSRRDIRFAKWLQRKLERYHVPVRLQKEQRLPKRIAPIVRDQSDLAGGRLEEMIHEKLGQSKYLIVLCSRAMAASQEWVNMEITYFCSLGYPQRVIPVVIDGYPNAANPGDECFPKPILDMQDQPMAISIPELGKSRALIKVISSLLEIRFDTLWGRERRRKRRTRFLTGLACAAFACLALFALYQGNQRSEIAQHQAFVQTLQSAEQLVNDGWYSYAQERLQRAYRSLSPVNQAAYADAVSAVTLRAFYRAAANPLCGTIQLDGLYAADVRDILFSADASSLYLCYDGGFLQYDTANGALLRQYDAQTQVEKHCLDESAGKLIAFVVGTGEPVVFDEATGQRDTAWTPGVAAETLQTTNRRRIGEQRTLQVEKSEGGVVLTEAGGLQISVPLDETKYTPYTYLAKAYLSPDGRYAVLPVMADDKSHRENGCLAFPVDAPLRQLFFACDPECSYGFSSNGERTLFIDINDVVPFQVVDIARQTMWEVPSGGGYGLFAADDFSTVCVTNGSYMYLFRNLAAVMARYLPPDTGMSPAYVIQIYRAGRTFENAIDCIGGGGQTERYSFTVNRDNALAVEDLTDQTVMRMDTALDDVMFLGSVAVNEAGDLALVSAGFLGDTEEDGIFLYAVDAKNHALSLLHRYEIGMTLGGMAFAPDNQSFTVLQGYEVSVYAVSDGSLLRRYSLAGEDCTVIRSDGEESAAVQYFVTDALLDPMKDTVLLHYEYFDNSTLTQYIEVYRLSTGEYLYDGNIAAMDGSLCYESEYSLYNYDYGLLVVGRGDLILAQFPVLPGKEGLLE